MNDPLLPLPPSWQMISHDTSSAEGEPYDTTGYQRRSDGLRVFVTDTKSNTGTKRIVSASAPAPKLSINQEREVKHLFLRADRPIRMGEGPTRTNVRLFIQIVEGEWREEAATRQIMYNHNLARDLLSRPDVDEWMVMVRGERVEFQFRCKDGYWRYSFTRPHREVVYAVHGSYEWLRRELAVHAATQHYESVRAGLEFSRPAVPDGREVFLYDGAPASPPRGKVRVIRAGESLRGDLCGEPGDGERWLGDKRCGSLWLDLWDGRSIELRIHRHASGDWWYQVRVPLPDSTVAETMSSLEWPDQRAALAAAMASFASISMGESPNVTDASFPGGHARDATTR